MRTFKIGGVHPPENKLTAGKAIADIAPAPELTIMLSQHIGAPAKACVAKGDHVGRGQKIAEAAGVVSAAVHSPVSGTVTKITGAKNPQGFTAESIVIKADAQQPEITSAQRRETASLKPEEIVRMIAEAGIVGLGGATFPTTVKLTPPPAFKPETVIINAVECEPYLTNDHALMLEAPDDIIEGTRLLMRATGVNQAVIAIENNKPDAIKLLRDHLAGATDIKVMPLKVKYPQGGEKQLIEAVTGRRVPSGGLPVATGAIVQNVATAYAVARAIIYGEPLISRIVTVTGKSVRNPGNYRVQIGTPLKHLIEAAGGLPEDTGKVILGGPMMGRTAMTLESFTVKGMSGILILDRDSASRREPEPCIRCASCVGVCPMGLEPYLLSTLSRAGRYDEAENGAIADCLECGSCSYVCPSARPLLDFIRVGKQKVMANIRARSKKN